MNVHRGIIPFTLALGLIACGDKEDNTPPPAPTPVVTAAPAPTPTQTAPTDLRPEGAGTNSAIESRVKSELDGRTDGLTGTPVAVTGAAASLQAPTGWQTTKGDVTVASSTDKRAQLAAAAVGAEGASGKLPAAVAALGLSNCQWNPPEPVTVGAGKLGASAADGVCTRGTTQVRTAYVAPNAERLLVVGGWESGADSASVFGAMRSIAKAGGGGGDASGIAACCAALRQNANSAPPEQKGAYLMAASACDAVRSSPQGRQALGAVRAALAGASVPSSCR